jgi:hypothetical protein
MQCFPVVPAQAGTHGYPGYRPKPVLGLRGARTRGPVLPDAAMRQRMAQFIDSLA